MQMSTSVPDRPNNDHQSIIRMIFSSRFDQFRIPPEIVPVSDVSTPAIVKLDETFLICVYNELFLGTRATCKMLITLVIHFLIQFLEVQAFPLLPLAGALQFRVICRRLLVNVPLSSQVYWWHALDVFV